MAAGGIADKSDPRWVEYIDTIAKVDCVEWDALAGQNVLMCHAWLKTLEETYLRSAPRRYVLLRDSKGILAAVAGMIEEHSTDITGLDRVIFGRGDACARRLGLTTLPSFVCGTRMGTGEPILVRSGLPADTRALLIDELMVFVEQMARDKGWTVCFREVEPTNTEVMAVLGRRGYLRIRELPMAFLDIGWDSFSAYRQHLRRAHPATEKNISTELNRGARAGVIIEPVEDPAVFGDRLHHLLDGHYFRLNRQRFPFEPDLCKQMKFNLGDRALVYVARSGDELLGVLVGLRGDRTVYLPAIGVDIRRGKAASVYFNLGYNHPIQDAITAGDRRICFGKMLYRLKASRGCRASDGNLYFRCWSPHLAIALRSCSVVRSWRVAAMSAAIPREGAPIASRAAGSSASVS